MANKGQFQRGREPHNKGKTGLPRRKPDPPFVAETHSEKKRAQDERDKMVRGLSTMAGMAQGLDSLSVQMIIAAKGPDGEHELWESKAREIAKKLLKFASRLKKGAENGNQRANIESSQS